MYPCPGSLRFRKIVILRLDPMSFPRNRPSNPIPALRESAGWAELLRPVQQIQHGLRAFRTGGLGLRRKHAIRMPLHQAKSQGFIHLLECPWRNLLIIFQVRRSSKEEASPLVK